ncbi:hypothetical protein ACFWF7_28545 [Nocardia sp. NPDC060256]|uniref:hypothetical protein n=1 Tax=unclassified Nocardia TaxID=2637762 RepID=UPI00365B5F3F
MHALAQHARVHAEHRGFAAFLTDMAGQGRYGRRIALHVAMAARDLTYIARVLAGPDPELRRAALRAVRTLPIPDEAIPPALHEASTELRIAVYRSIVHARRTELADALLPEVNERWGAKEACLLLAACSPPIVAEWLPSLAHAVTAWKTLTRRHPQLVLRCLDDQFAHSRRLALRRAVALREAARVEPALVLDLFERHDLGRWAECLPGNVLGPLFRADLHRTARLLPKQRWMSYESKSALLKRCAQFSDDQLLTLVSTRSQADVLRALPIPRRGAIYARMEHGEIAALHLLHLLPRELAVSEARRLREWHTSVWHSSRAHLDDPKIILRITAFLPFEEAEPELRAAAFTGDPRRRDIARTLLLGAAQRSGDRVKAAAVLGELVDRIRNERDPSRAAFLESLAGLHLDPRWAEHLDRLADAAIHARDTSERTREAVRKLADRALNTEPALTSWALRSYARLIDRFGAAALTRSGSGAVDRRHRRLSARVSSRPTLGRVLRRGQEHELLAMLTRPRDHELTVALARSLGTRLRALPELRQDLRQAVLDGPDEVAGEAAELMLRRIRDKDTQVAALLADDPRAIRFAPVWHNVATRRTDLLPADPREVLVEHDIEPGMPGRWTDRQRDTLGATLAAIVDDRDAPVEDRIRVLRGLGRIPLHAKLIEHALGGEPVIAEAAIEACGGYPEVLPQLLLRIPGPMALATAAKLCRVSAPSRLRDALAQALFEGRVGARKLAARQLVAQRVPGAADLLLRAWAEPELHPDVRIAVALALQRLPEDERARAALAEVPGRYASELMIRTLLQAIPEEYAPDHRAALADLVRGLLTAAEGPGVQFRAAKAFAIWVPWYRGGTDAIIERAVTGGDTDMTVFLSLVRSGVIRAEALTVLRRLLDAENHVRAREVASALNASMYNEEWEQDRARAAAELLFEHPKHLLGAAGMVIYRLPTGDFDPQVWVRELSMLADRLTPVAAAWVISTFKMHFAWNEPIERRLPAVEALIARGDLTAGVLAAGILNGSSRSPERTAAIEQLRSSPHLDLCRLAWEVGQ